MKRFLAPEGIGTFWNFIKTYIDKKITMVRNELKTISPTIPVGSELKCFYFSTPANVEYMDIRFSVAPTSDDYFLVYGRSSRQGWNDGTSTLLGVLGYSNYDAAFYWVTIDVNGRLFTSSRNASSGQPGGYLTINPFTSDPTKFRFYCGEHARLWFLTTSATTMMQVT